MLLKIKADRTIHPDFFVNGNDLQTEKGGWNMAKKEFEIQGKWKIRKHISIPFEYLKCLGIE